MDRKRLKGLTNGSQRRHKGDKGAMIGQELGKTGHEPTPDHPDGFQMTELGPLPKDWRVVRLGEVARFGSDRRTQQTRNPLTPFVPMSLLDQKTRFTFGVAHEPVVHHSG